MGNIFCRRRKIESSNESEDRSSTQNSASAESQTSLTRSGENTSSGYSSQDRISERPPSTYSNYSGDDSYIQTFSDASGSVVFDLRYFYQTNFKVQFVSET